MDNLLNDGEKRQNMSSACCEPRKFFTQGLWIEGEAESQFEKAANLEGAVGAFAMPDLHPGKGIPIGSALITRELFYPHLAGNDLGCGAFCGKLVGAKRLNPDALSKKKWLRNEPDLSFWDDHMQKHAPLWSAWGLDASRNARTIGGGNHFLEIGSVEAVFDLGEETLCPGDFVVMAHSGSRHLGEAVARLWTDRFKAGPARSDEPFSATWLQAHDACLDWAKANRLALASHASDVVGADLAELSDATHNAIEKLGAGQMEQCGIDPSLGPCYLHRKGASKADSGLALLPGSRGDFSFLMQPLDIGSSGLSLAHGAGRKWRRSDCEGRLARFSAEDLQKSKLGSRIICSDKALLFEEAPQAYKDCQSVADALSHHGLAKIVAKIKPLLTLKI